MLFCRYPILRVPLLPSINLFPVALNVNNSQDKSRRSLTGGAITTKNHNQSRTIALTEAVRHETTKTMWHILSSLVRGSPFQVPGVLPVVTCFSARLETERDALRDGLVGCDWFRFYRKALFGFVAGVRPVLHSLTVMFAFWGLSSLSYASVRFLQFFHCLWLSSVCAPSYRVRKCCDIFLLLSASHLLVHSHTFWCFSVCFGHGHYALRCDLLRILTVTSGLF